MVALALGALIVLPTGSQAEISAPGSVVPLRTVAAVQLQQVASAQDIVGLPLNEAREKVSDTEGELLVSVLQKTMDDRELAGARLAVEELEVEAAEIADLTRKSAVSSYRHTANDTPLLDVSDLNEIFRANALGDAALVADTGVFDDFHNTNKVLAVARDNLGAEQAENEALGALVQALQDRLDAEQSWLAIMEERAIHEQGRLDSVQESIWAQALGTRQGFFLRFCPVDGEHDFIDSWGFPRSGGRRHQGVDIIADIGVPIVAPNHGTVEFRSNQVGGRSFHFWDEHGNYFYGTHLSAYGETQGEVRAGEVIGYVGDDGNAAGIPHLHFEIHPGGRGNAINPFIDTATVCAGAVYN